MQGRRGSRSAARVRGSCGSAPAGRSRQTLREITAAFRLSGTITAARRQSTQTLVGAIRATSSCADRKLPRCTDDAVAKHHHANPRFAQRARRRIPQFSAYPKSTWATSPGSVSTGIVRSSGRLRNGCEGSVGPVASIRRCCPGSRGAQAADDRESLETRGVARAVLHRRLPPFELRHLLRRWPWRQRLQHDRLALISRTNSVWHSPLKRTAAREQACLSATVDHAHAERSCQIPSTEPGDRSAP